MWEDGSISSASKNDAGTQQIPLFTCGKVGMITLGAFAIPSIEKAKINFGVTPIPGKDGGTASFAGGDVISVINGTKNEAGAEDFVKWATDERGPDLPGQERQRAGPHRPGARDLRQPGRRRTRCSAS